LQGVSAFNVQSFGVCGALAGASPKLSAVQRDEGTRKFEIGDIKKKKKKEDGFVLIDGRRRQCRYGELVRSANERSTRGGSDSTPLQGTSPFIFESQTVWIRISGRPDAWWRSSKCATAIAVTISASTAAGPRRQRQSLARSGGAASRPMPPRYGNRHGTLETGKLLPGLLPKLFVAVNARRGRRFWGRSVQVEGDMVLQTGTRPSRWRAVSQPRFEASCARSDFGERRERRWPYADAASQLDYDVNPSRAESFPLVPRCRAVLRRGSRFKLTVALFSMAIFHLLRRNYGNTRHDLWYACTLLSARIAWIECRSSFRSPFFPKMKPCRSYSRFPAVG